MTTKEAAAGGYPYYPYGEGGKEKPFDIKYYLYLGKKNVNILLTFFVITVTMASIYAAKLSNRYQAVAQIIIEKPKETWGTKTDDGPPRQASGWSEDYYNTQMEIMRGTTVLRQVVEELKLNEYFKENDEDALADRLRSMVRVYRIRGSRLFNLEVVSGDPMFTANVANAVARAYIRKNFEDSLYYSKEILGWLPQQGQSATDMISVQDPFGGIRQITRQELIESLPSIQTDPTIRNLRQKKNALESELRSLLRRFREKHPAIIKARANLKFLTDSVEAEKKRIIESMRLEAEGRLQVTHARIIEEAQEPKGPIGPNRLRIVLQIAVIELFLSFIFLFIIDFFDESIHSMEDLERKGLALPFLGPIPLVQDRTMDTAQKALIASQNKLSEIVEAFRYLRVAINFSASPESIRNLAVTSCLPHEGKSFVAHNIAISLAMDGNKTLLVDGDLRRPTVHNNFRIDNSTGLSNFLTSHLELESILKESFVENLYLVVAGPVSPNPAEILGSDRMKVFLEKASEKFDRIIIDCPPLTGIGDGFVVGGLLGAITLVIAAGKTPADLIRRTQEQIEKASIKIVGVVLNQVDMEKERYGGYSKYYYRTYNRYYSPEEKEK